ncbi:MAG TPA: hypothetical protein VJK29_19120 [Terriglobales bacterium]|nr:hypothetical protein [Terriglobales bacterium]
MGIHSRAGVCGYFLSDRENPNPQVEITFPDAGVAALASRQVEDEFEQVFERTHRVWTEAADGTWRQRVGVDGAETPRNGYVVGVGSRFFTRDAQNGRNSAIGANGRIQRHHK